MVCPNMPSGFIHCWLRVIRIVDRKPLSCNTICSIVKWSAHVVFCCFVFHNFLASKECNHLLLHFSSDPKFLFNHQCLMAAKESLHLSRLMPPWGLSSSFLTKKKNLISANFARLIVRKSRKQSNESDRLNVAVWIDWRLVFECGYTGYH